MTAIDIPDDYSVAIAKGGDRSFATFYLCSFLKLYPFLRDYNPRIRKHRKIVKIDKKKAKSKICMAKQSRKHNR